MAYPFSITVNGTAYQREVEPRLLLVHFLREHLLLTGTLVDGRFVLRICILSFRTHRDRIEQGLEDIEAAVGEVVRART